MQEIDFWILNEARFSNASQIFSIFKSLKIYSTYFITMEHKFLQSPVVYDCDCPDTSSILSDDEYGAKFDDTASILSLDSSVADLNYNPNEEYT